MPYGIRKASYALLVENAPFADCALSTRNGTIVQANPALVQMLGYTSEQEVLGLHMATDVYHDSEEREVQRMVPATRLRASIEVDWKRKDGRPFTIRCDAHVV